MRLFRATGIVMVAVAISALFGLLRETVIAAEFGTTADADAYFFAYELVGLLPEFLAAAFAGALIPVYLRGKSEGGNDRLVNTVVSTYLLLLTVLAVITTVTAPIIVAVAGAGFDDGVSATAVLMIRILSPATVLIGLWGILKIILNAEGQFFVSTVSQAFLSVGVIASTLLFASEIGIEALPYGVLAAAVMQVLWAAYWVRKAGIRYRFSLDVDDPAFQRFLKLLRPGLIGALVLWFIPVIEKIVASYLPEGTIAALSFAGRPVTILRRFSVDALVITILPVFSLNAITTGLAGFKTSVERTIAIVLFLLTPVTFIVAALRVPIIQVLFERGAFEPGATATTADMMAALVLGLIPVSVAVTVSAVFKALEDTRTPAYYGAGSSLLSKAVLSPPLAFLLGGLGLAIATSLMSLISAIVLLSKLRKKVDVSLAVLGRTFSRIVGASLFAATPAYLVVEFTTLAPIFALTIGTVIGAALFLVGALVLQMPELEALIEQLRSRSNPETVNNLKPSES